MEIVVNRDGAILFKHNAECLKTQAFGTRLATSSHQDDVGINIGDILYSSLHFEVDALFLQVLTQTLGDVAIKGRQALLQELNDSNLGAKAMKHRGELHTDDASTDNGKTLGQGIEVQKACRINHTRVVLTLDREPLGL